MKPARLAHSLEQLRLQIDLHFPDRDKSSDGWIGDAHHAARVSDHNPNSAGVVTAIDITHDPDKGPDCNELYKELQASADNRIKYIIFSGHIAAADHGLTNERRYHGANPHNHHLHISVKATPAIYDDSREWKLTILGSGPDA